MRWTVSQLRVVMSRPQAFSSEAMNPDALPGSLVSMTARTTRAAGSYRTNCVRASDWPGTGTVGGMASLRKVAVR
jgi:hypothetical protein